MGGGLNTGTTVAVLPALAVKPNNSVFPCMFLVPPEPLSLSWSPGRVPGSESVCSPLRRCLGFQQSFISPRGLNTHLIARCCGSSSPALVLKAREPNVRLGPFAPQRGPFFSSCAIPPDSQLPHVCMGPACFMSPPLLPV